MTSIDNGTTRTYGRHRLLIALDVHITVASLHLFSTNDLRFFVSIVGALWRLLCVILQRSHALRL